MPITAKQAVLVAKVQTTAGTYSEPAATDWVEITDVTLTPFDADETELALIKRTYGANQQIPYNYRAKLAFSIPLAGSGTAGTAPYWGTLERICGMAQTIVATTSVTYAPADSTFEIGSLAMYIGPNKHAMRDARGTSSLEISRGGFLVRKYEITGVYIDPVAATVPSVAIAPRVMPEILLSTNTALSLHGTSGLCMAGMTIDTGFDVKFLSFLGCTDQVALNDRATKGTIELVAESIATKDWFTACKTAATGALAVTLNAAGAAGKRLAVNAPKVQLMNPTYGDADGIKTLKMDMILLPSAGSDDYSIVNT